MLPNYILKGSTNTNKLLTRSINVSKYRRKEEFIYFPLDLEKREVFFFPSLKFSLLIHLAVQYMRENSGCVPDEVFFLTISLANFLSSIQVEKLFNKHTYFFYL